MITTMNQRRNYERPAMTIVELGQPERLLAGSAKGARMELTYEEEDF